MGGNVALYEQRADLRVEAAGQQLLGLAERGGPELGRVVLLGERVQVDDTEEGVRPVLVDDPEAHRPEIVAQLQGSGRLDAREHPVHGRQVTVHGGSLRGH